MRQLLLLVLLLFAAAHAEAQGCSQCRDTVAQSDPSLQRGYREAITILLCGAVGAGAAAFLVLRRFGR